MLLIFKWISDKELVLESKGCYCVCVCCENMLCRVKIVYIVCNIFLKYIIIIFLIYIYRICVCVMFCKIVYSLLFKKGVYVDYLFFVNEYWFVILLYKEYRFECIMLCINYFLCYVLFRI